MSVNNPHVLEEAMLQHNKNMTVIMDAEPKDFGMLMIRNDTFSPLKKEKPNREIFDACVSAAHTEEMMDKKLLGYYVYFYAIMLINLYKKRVDVETYLVTNPLIWDRITPDECAYVTKMLDPGIVTDPALLPVMKHIFSKFLELINRKNAFSPAPRLRAIEGSVASTILNAIVSRFVKDRFVNSIDELPFAKMIAKLGREKARLKVREVMKERGLDYTPPICQNYEPYLNVYEKLGGKEIFVLPLDSPLYFQVMNPKLMLKKGGFSSVRFQFEVYVPVKEGKKISHKTLIRETQIRTSADKDSNVIFSNVELDAKVDEPELGEFQISSLNANNEQIDHFSGNLIILPKGEKVLKVRNRKFREVIIMFENMGLLNKEQVKDALSELPSEMVTDIEELLALPLPKDIIGQ